MDTTKPTQEASDKIDFEKKILANLQYLHPYVKHRLYIAESTRIVPRNMYSSNGIIDDCIIKLYDKGYNIDADIDDIKLELFECVDIYLEDLFLKEIFHKKTISTDQILKEELFRLEESFTIDADEDFMMLEQLDDISYHQHDHDFEVFVFDDHNSKVLNALESQSDSQQINRARIGKFYNWLPVRVANVVDLYTFGKLSFKEIARVKHIEVSRVEKILKEVKKRFRTHLE